MMGLIAKLKTWAAILAAAMSGALLLWLHGRREGREAAKAEAQRANIEAMQKARKVENEVQALDARAIHNRLNDRWMRSD